MLLNIIVLNFLQTYRGSLCMKMCVCYREQEETQLRNDKPWFRQQNNARANSALSAKTFLAKHNIPVLEYPPYSPDLPPSTLSPKSYKS